MSNHLYNLLPHFFWKFNKNNYKKLDLIYYYLHQQNISVNECSFLDNGCYGSVFKINNKMVMKVSNDESEIHSMTIVRDNPHKNIVKVYDVFKCKFGHKTKYFIIQELLNEADELWKLFANTCLYDEYGNDAGDITISVVKTLKTIPLMEQLEEDKNTDKKWKWLMDIAAYLERHHIDYADLCDANIMKRRKRHVLIDVGCCECPKQYVNEITI